MEEQQDPKDNRLRVSRSIEDAFRDHMVALAYMNSAQFGKGISVTPGHVEEVVVEESDAVDQKPIADINDRLAAFQSIDVFAAAGDIAPKVAEESEAIESPPPLSVVPFEIPKEEPISTGFFLDAAGLQREEFPQPVSPVQQESIPEVAIPASAIPPEFRSEEEPFAVPAVEVPSPVLPQHQQQVDVADNAFAQAAGEPVQSLPVIDVSPQAVAITVDTAPIPQPPDNARQVDFPEPQLAQFTVDVTASVPVEPPAVVSPVQAVEAPAAAIQPAEIVDAERYIPPEAMAPAAIDFNPPSIDVSAAIEAAASLASPPPQVKPADVAMPPVAQDIELSVDAGPSPPVASPPSVVAVEFPVDNIPEDFVSEKQDPAPEPPPPQASMPFPFLSGPEVRIDPAYLQDQFTADTEEYIPSDETKAALEGIQLANRDYMETINTILHGISADIREFRSRLLEIETVYDRRYFRR